MPNHVSFLLDNGSLRAGSVLNLRRITSELSCRVGESIRPVSLLHSNGIDSAELEGAQAEIFQPAIIKQAEAGIRNFLIIPLFFGLSKALTEHLPERIDTLKQYYPGLAVTVTPPLVDLSKPLDMSMAAILSDGVKQVVKKHGLLKPKVILTDHGTPAKEVNAVRNHLARQLLSLLDRYVAEVRPASMERKEGKAYDFNEPLLESLLLKKDFAKGDVILSMLFLSPGRHAGPGGDIEVICKKTEEENPALQTHITALVGENSRLINILETRYRFGLETMA